MLFDHQAVNHLKKCRHGAGSAVDSFIAPKTSLDKVCIQLRILGGIVSRRLSGADKWKTLCEVGRQALGNYLKS